MLYSCFYWARWPKHVWGPSKSKTYTQTLFDLNSLSILLPCHSRRLDWETCTKPVRGTNMHVMLCYVMCFALCAWHHIWHSTPCPTAGNATFHKNQPHNSTVFTLCQHSVLENSMLGEKKNDNKSLGEKLFSKSQFSNVFLPIQIPCSTNRIWSTILENNAWKQKQVCCLATHTFRNYNVL